MQLTCDLFAIAKFLLGLPQVKSCRCIRPMAFDETALPVLAKGKNTNIKLSEKGYNVEFILS